MLLYHMLLQLMLLYPSHITLSYFILCHFTMCYSMLLMPLYHVLQSNMAGKETICYFSLATSLYFAILVLLVGLVYWIIDKFVCVHNVFFPAGEWRLRRWELSACQQFRWRVWWIKRFRGSAPEKEETEAGHSRRTEEQSSEESQCDHGKMDIMFCN